MPVLDIDPDADDLRPVRDLCERLTGRRPSPPTVWRWCSRGTRRAGRLPAIQVYGAWHTTPAALLAWLRGGSERPTLADDGVPTERPASTRRRLAAAGLIREGGDA